MTFTAAIMQSVICILLLLGTFSSTALSISTAKCSTQDVGLRFGIDSSCSQFLVCLANYTIDVRFCPPGLYFNEELQVCDFASRVYCGVERNTLAEMCAGIDVDLCCTAGVPTTIEPATTTTCTPVFTTIAPPLCSSDQSPTTTVAPSTTETTPTLPPCTDEITTTPSITQSIPTVITTVVEPSTTPPTAEETTISETTTVQPPDTETPQTALPITTEPPTTHTPQTTATTTADPLNTQPHTTPPLTTDQPTISTIVSLPTIESSTTPPTSTATSSSTSTAQPPSDCQCCDVRDGTVFVQNGHCENFVVCVGGEDVVMNCPNNLLFNNVTRQCDYPENVECPWAVLPSNGAHAGPSGTYCTSGGRCVGQPDGYQLPDEISACSTFYVVCQCECEISRNCSDPLMYNPALGVCDWPTNFGCAASVY